MDIEGNLKTLEEYSDTLIANTIGLPMLTARLAQIAVHISNNPELKASQEKTNQFILSDLSSYSEALKSKNCAAHIMFDRYIRNFKEQASEQ